MKRIAIIVGHSYKEQGAVSDKGITEYTYNSKLASYLAYEVHKQGMQPIIIYRDTLKSLPDLVNSTNADVCISLHCNAFDKSISGSETLYYHTSKQSKALAERVQKALLDALDLKDRGIKPIQSKQRGGYILKNTSMPCVLIEPFFIDNWSDLEIAQDRLPELAESIARALY